MVAKASKEVFSYFRNSLPLSKNRKRIGMEKEKRVRTRRQKL